VELLLELTLFIEHFKKVALSDRKTYNIVLKFSLGEVLFGEPELLYTNNVALIYISCGGCLV